MDKRDKFITAENLWKWQAHNFNYELNVQQVLSLALEHQLVSKVEGKEGFYLINPYFGIVLH